MMKGESNSDSVLYDYSVEPNHNADTLAEYLRKYPEFASDLVALHREIIFDSGHRGSIVEEADEALIGDAWKKLQHSASAPKTSFAALGVEGMRELAINLKVPRSFLISIRDRMVVLRTIPVSFLYRLATSVGCAVEELEKELRMPGTVKGRSYKSEERPATDEQVSFEELLVSYKLTLEDLALDEDKNECG